MLSVKDMRRLFAFQLFMLFIKKSYKMDTQKRLFNVFAEKPNAFLEMIFLFASVAIRFAAGTDTFSIKQTSNADIYSL